MRPREKINAAVLATVIAASVTIGVVTQSNQACTISGFILIAVLLALRVLRY